MPGSNRRPPACKAGALPAELIPLDKISSFSKFVQRFVRSVRQYVSTKLWAKFGKVVGVPGLEPGTSPLSGVHSNQLSYTPLYQ